ncbi:MAG: hypothetical protein KGQ66_01570 [Acidobacteriota bacterium]|nr:hypothetical protein [Acidobacteriota bacterium]
MRWQEPPWGERQLGPKPGDGNVEAIRARVVAKPSAKSTKIATLNQIRHLGFTDTPKSSARPWPR